MKLTPPFTRKLTAAKTHSHQISEIVPGRLWQSGAINGVLGPTAGAIADLGIRVIVDMQWIEDGDLPDGNTRAEIHQLATDLAQVHSRMLITCFAGTNRASLLTCLLLQRLNPNWTGKRAVQELESKRPGVLTNDKFRAYITAQPSLGNPNG